MQDTGRRAPAPLQAIRSADLAASWGVRKRCIDRVVVSIEFASMEEQRACLSLRMRPGRVLPESLARVEILAPGDARAAVLVRLRRPGKRVREWIHA
jgi:hypothetical protein